MMQTIQVQLAITLGDDAAKGLADPLSPALRQAAALLAKDIDEGGECTEVSDAGLKERRGSCNNFPPPASGGKRRVLCARSPAGLAQYLAALFSLALAASCGEALVEDHANTVKISTSVPV